MLRYYNVFGWDGLKENQVMLFPRKKGQKKKRNFLRPPPQIINGRPLIAADPWQFWPFFALSIKLYLNIDLMICISIKVVTF